MDQVKKRNSSIELLRIISIYMIVLGHACRHGIIDNNNFDSQMLSHFSNVIIYIFSAGGGTANRIFILITGYFLAWDDQLMTQKLSNLIVKDHLYSALICVFLYALGSAQVSTKMIIESAFPIWFGLNWFVTCYILLLICIPFINIFIRNISVEALSRFAIIILVIRYLAGSLFAKTFMNIGNTLEEFVIMYLIGSLLSKGGDKFARTREFVYLTCAGIIGLILSDSALYFILVRFTSLSQRIQVTHFHGLFEVMIAVGAFGIAVNKTIHSRTINIVAGCTLGTYLIHDNPMLREIIWKNTMIMQILSAHLDIGIVIIIIYAIFVMVVCFIMDGFVRVCFRKPMQKASLRVEKTITRLLKRLPQ